MNGVQIAFGFECNVMEVGIAFEQFEFDVTAQSRTAMIGLCGYRLGR